MNARESTEYQSAPNHTAERPGSFGLSVVPGGNDWSCYASTEITIEDYLPPIGASLGDQPPSSPSINVLQPDQASWFDACQNSATIIENTGIPIRKLENHKKKRKRKQPIEQEAATPTPYKCRFCSRAFEKLQALGGHMNGHRKEKEDEEAYNAYKLIYDEHIHTKKATFKHEWHNTSSSAFQSQIQPQQPSQIQEQFTESATHNSWECPSMIQSHLKGTQDQQGINDQIPSLPGQNLGHVQSISYGSTTNMNASGSYVKPNVSVPNNVQGFPTYAKTMNMSYVSQGQSELDMFVMRGYGRNQEPQSLDHQPRHLPWDANSFYLQLE